jgi:hypothetical protein
LIHRNHVLPTSVHNGVVDRCGPCGCTLPVHAHSVETRGQPTGVKRGGEILSCVDPSRQHCAVVHGKVVGIDRNTLDFVFPPGTGLQNTRKHKLSGEKPMTIDWLEAERGFCNLHRHKNNAMWALQPIFHANKMHVYNQKPNPLQPLWYSLRNSGFHCQR